MDPALLDAIRSSVDRTCDAGTARLQLSLDYDSRVVESVTDLLRGIENPPRLGGAAQTGLTVLGKLLSAGESALSRYATRTGEGEIDLAAGRSLVRWAGGGERYDEPGLQLRRSAAGRWHANLEAPAGTSALSPAWMLELPRGVEAARVRSAGAAGWHLSGVARIDEAAARSRYGMETRTLSRLEDGRLPFELWIDPRGRAERVRCTVRTGDPRQLKPVTDLSQELALAGLGSATPPARPETDR